MMHQINRRNFLRKSFFFAAGLSGGCLSTAKKEKHKRPNLLVAISDDQTWKHAGAYGCDFVKTPAFDRIANEGVLFNNAFCPAPQCSPARAAMLTGKNIWELEEAGVLFSKFPAKFDVYPQILKKSGYFTGHTGKGWAPGDFKKSGRSINPAGKTYNRKKIKVPTSGIWNIDYAGNFRSFIEDKPEDKPFCFWYGGFEPHRPYKRGSGSEAGKKRSKVNVPEFLPDEEKVRGDLLDYAFEIEWFDKHLGRMIDLLEEKGELDNTIIVVTGDNGMPFPKAKATLYEYGTHVPLAVRWGDKVKPGRVVDDPVSFIDLMPTFLEAADVKVPNEVTGKSIMNILLSARSGRVEPERQFVLTGFERHTLCREGDVGYPCRAIRTDEYLYIKNFKPDRWPAGDPPTYGDVDPFGKVTGSATKEYMIKNKAKHPELFEAAFGKRRGEELYNIKKDEACLKNLAEKEEYKKIKEELRNKLMNNLKQQKDPRVLSNGAIFNTYPFYWKTD